MAPSSPCRRQQERRRPLSWSSPDQPAGQTAAFKSKGNLPSSPSALSDPAVTAAINEYFSNAPTGEIFAAGAPELKPVYLGPKNRPVRTAVENALRAVEQGQVAAEAWNAALKNGKAAGK